MKSQQSLDIARYQSQHHYSPGSMYSACQRTVIIVADSSLGHTAFRYGIQLVLRFAGFRLLWMCVRPGAKAKDFITMWEKAPRCDFGITIYNGNDFISKDQASESQIQEHLQSMVDASSLKCGTPFFIRNDPKFFAVSIKVIRVLESAC